MGERRFQAGENANVVIDVTPAYKALDEGTYTGPIGYYDEDGVLRHFYQNERTSNECSSDENVGKLQCTAS